MSTGTSRAQSETLGYILVFALVIAGAGVTVAIGGSGIIDTQSTSEFQRAQNSMTLFDSRAAMVALGDSKAQTVSFGQDAGSVSVDEDSGWIRVTHHNYTGESDTHNEVIYNKSLGKVVYEGGNGKMAYQGGGVWRLEDGGDALMVSPPEFHYRGATLTLPSIRVFGSGQVSGDVDITVTPVEQARLIYPNKTTATGNHVGAPYNTTASTSHRNYTNPVRNGTVTITVNSEFADGWESYFEERTTGETKRLGENTVQLRLETTTGAPGEFEMPDAGDSVNAGSIADGHPIQDFDVTIDVEDKNPHFSFYAQEDSQEFEIHVTSDINPKKKKCEPSGSKVHMSVYYYSGDGSKEYENWESGAIDPDTNDGMEWICDGDNTKLALDFISSDVTMTYDRVGTAGTYDPESGGTNFDEPNSGTATGITRGNKWAFNDRLTNQDGFSLKSQSVWDQHPTVTYESGSGTTFNQNGTDPDTRTLEAVTNHYLGLVDDEVNLIAKDGPGNSNSINEDLSRGKLLYEEAAGSRYVTFLHITENQIKVELD